MTTNIILIVMGILWLLTIGIWYVDRRRYAFGRLQESFKAAAIEALEGNAKHFYELAKSSLEKESSLARMDLDQKQKSIQDMLQPLSFTLNKYEEQLRGLELQRQKSFLGLEEQLRQLSVSQGDLLKTTGALKDALKKPHVRGRWGEVQLKNCIELAGMSEYCDTSFQDSSLTAEGDRLIPDMVVRMPGGRKVIVDAKTPLDAFIASLEAPTEEIRAAEMLRHGRHLKEHVKRLAIRAYPDSLKDSADFTVMFLPNESFLYGALEAEPDLIEFALQKKILISTPPTLIGFLKVILYGWNEQRLAENAQKISDAGVEMHKRVVEFIETYMAVGKALDKAKSEFDAGLGRLERRLLPQTRRMEALGAKSIKDLPESLGKFEINETSSEV